MSKLVRQVPAPRTPPPAGAQPRRAAPGPRLAMPPRTEEGPAPVVGKFPVLADRRLQKTREKVWDPFSSGRLPPRASGERTEEGCEEGAK